MELEKMNFLVEDPWMTNFYGKKWFQVKSENIEVPYDQKMFLEWRISASEPMILQKALNLNFELVETAVEFETTVFSDTTNIPTTIRTAQKEDLKGILSLVDKCYMDHNKFYNRLKNRKYFSVEQSRNYFQQSVLSNFENDESIIIVASNEEHIVGFYILKKIGVKKYKGISTGVDPKMRGRNLHILMQRKCSDVIKEPYTMINRTQLNNFKVLNNHIAEGKKLSAVEHILYLNL